jgi:lipopolysaccharide/colanic/teichoic acid biosynthesis glycosyltransferase
MGKRFLDISAAACGLLFLSPLLAALALAIRLTSPGPALFAQERLGLGGRTFRMYKFRSMVVDADRRGARVTAGGDPRITPLGRLLRYTKLDELPQLWNVLKGEMSLVGPRPEVPEFAAMFPEQYARILDVRPGITHRATLAFRSEERILSDAQVAAPREFYIDRVMPRKLAMYEDCLQDPLLRDVWTILETVSPWKTTPAVTAGELLLDAPQVGNVPPWDEPVRARPRLVTLSTPSSRGTRPSVAGALDSQLEELIDAVQNVR